MLSVAEPRRFCPWANRSSEKWVRVGKPFLKGGRVTSARVLRRGFLRQCRARQLALRAWPTAARSSVLSTNRWSPASQHPLAYRYGRNQLHQLVGSRQKEPGVATTAAFPEPAVIIGQGNAAAEGSGGR